MKQIKATGSNYQMYVYSTHDYMDLEPCESFITFKNDEDAKAFIKK